MVSIPACHAGDRGSIPRRGAFVACDESVVESRVPVICLPVTAPLLDSIVVSIPACHAGDRGSIPRRGAFVACDESVVTSVPAYDSENRFSTPVGFCFVC